MSEQGHPVADRMRQLIEDALAPTMLEIVDESHKHASHAHRSARPGGATGSGETHFNIALVSQAFQGKSRIDRHRIVNALLAPEMGPDKVHALAIDARAPGE